MLEDKDDIRKRIGRSTDGGDAAALTFAAPVRGGDSKVRNRTRRPEDRNTGLLKWRSRR